VGPRAGLDDVEREKIWTLSGLELRPLSRPARSQPLCVHAGHCSQQFPAGGLCDFQRILIFEILDRVTPIRDHFPAQFTEQDRIEIVEAAPTSAYIPCLSMLSAVLCLRVSLSAVDRGAQFCVGPVGGRSRRKSGVVMPSRSHCLYQKDERAKPGNLPSRKHYCLPPQNIYIACLSTFPSTFSFSHSLLRPLSLGVRGLVLCSTKV
jgi:hypothetical protein